MMTSTATTMDGSEFEAHLEQQGFSSERHSGWFIWRREIEISLSDNERFMKANIKRLLVEMAFQLRTQPSLIQFWAIEQQPQQQHLYLTTLDEPFAVGDQVLYRYRQRCMGYRIRVDEGADEEELGGVGRVYRNRRPESSPDLRLYITNEFPFLDDAKACGITSYCALPVFGFQFWSLYGVIEVLQLKSALDMFKGIHKSLVAANLRTSTHRYFWGSVEGVDNEIIEMLQWAKRITPQLQMAHVWTPCSECSNTNSNLSCMQRGYTIMNFEDNDMSWYREACEFHHLQIGEYSAVMWSGNKPRICQNVCDYTISENPLAHYAQKARLSFCFTVRLQHSRREFRVVEFFLQCNSREDEFSKSCLPLLLSIMGMKLKIYKFAYDGELGEELKVEVGESSGVRYESIEYEHQHSKELSMFKATEWGTKIYPPSDFTKYLINGNLHYSKTSAEQWGYGWVFWNHESENQSSLGFDVQERIKFFMKKIASRRVMGDYAVAQFWAPKLDGERCYLEVSGQPFALDQLHNGSADFRKQCMGHRYYVNGDGATKEDKLGPPGRVYLNGHPEITPDLRLYSPAEFPLRDDAASYGLTSYVALPIFELNKAECVGVLELLSFFDDTGIEVVGKELEAASLSSTHTTNFRPSSLTSPLSGNNDRELALTEIRQACEVFAAIPQVYMVEVWVPYDKCPINNNTNICMERVLTTERGGKWHPPLWGVQHVQTGKGIAGMALASENKACFSQHSCRFSITDQPLALYTRIARLDVCFAICLQSRHTGDLVYILHFYLNGSCRKYKYFKTFLCLLLPKIKQTLESFKVASGQELGEKLVVEVIEFSQVSELDFSESDQPDGLPITFKFVNYLAQGHSEVESVGIVAQEERGQCTTATTNLKIKDTAKEIEKRKGKRKKAAKDIEERKEKIKDMAKEIEGGKGKTKDTAKEIEGRKGKIKDTEKEIEGRKGKIKDTEKEIEGRKGKTKDTAKEIEGRKGKIKDTAKKIEGRKEKIEDTTEAIEGKKGKKRKITFEMLKPLFGRKLEDAAKILGVHKSTIKRVCRENKMIGWPWKENHKNNLAIYMEDQDMSNLPPNLVMADPQSSGGPTVEPKVDVVVIKAKYEDDTIRVELCRSEGLEKLMNEVEKRHKLSVGSFKLKYIDEDNDEILLACDDDLQQSLKIPIATNKPYLQVFVKLI